MNWITRVAALCTLPWILIVVRWLALALRDFAWTFRYKNDPVLYLHPRENSVLPGRIVYRKRAELHIEFLYDYNMPWPRKTTMMFLRDATLKLADEGTTWVRGLEGEEADAFRALVAIS